MPAVEAMTHPGGESAVSELSVAADIPHPADYSAGYDEGGCGSGIAVEVEAKKALIITAVAMVVIFLLSKALGF